MLKTTLKIIAIASFLTAGSHNLTLSVQAAEQVTGIVIGLEPIYTTRTIQIPHQVCNTVQVSSNNNSNFLQGAIIGGIIGNSLRGGSQVRNRNTSALIGGFIGSNQSTGQILRQENRCYTQYSRTSQQVVDQYWVVINVHGQVIRKAIWAHNGTTNVRLGQKIPLRVGYYLN